MEPPSESFEPTRPRSAPGEIERGPDSVPGVSPSEPVATRSSEGPDTFDEGQLIRVAARAFRQTRFFADLYGGEPTSVARVPFLTEADYHRASGVLDCIVDRRAIVGVVPPYDRDASRFPWTVAEDEAELILRQRRIVRAMRHLGVDFDARPRFLIVTDRRRGPFACELAKGLYWEGFQASICFDVRSAEDLRRQAALHAPDFVILVSGRSFRRSIDRPREAIWLAERCGDGPIGSGDFPALLYADGVDLIGARAAGEFHYDCDAEQLHIESHPESGLSHVTKLQFSCFPLVRYGLGQRVPTAAAPARDGLP